MSEHNFETTDAVCAQFADIAQVRLEIREFTKPDTGEEPPFLLVEADSKGFEFLGHLFLAFAHSEEGCHRYLSPYGSGSTFFREGTGFGFLLHRLPCEHLNTPPNESSKRLL